MSITFETHVDQIRKVDPKRNYWFLRTYGGQTFEDFYNKEYVGIGFNNVPFEYLGKAKSGNVSDIDRIKQFLFSNYNIEGGENTKWTNQLLEFQHILSIGDLIVIPSKNSDLLAIGEIISDVFVTKDSRTFLHDGKYEPYPEKRRKVRWISSKSKYDLKTEAGDFFLPRTALTNINTYSELIEGQVSSLYIKDNKTYLVIQIKQDSEINAFHFSRFLDNLTYFYLEFCKENGYEPNEELYLKIKMQSKGLMALAAFVAAGMLGLALLVVLSNDTTFKLDMGDGRKLEGHSEGFVKTLSDFLDRDQERKIRFEKFRDSMDYLRTQRLEEASIEKKTPNQIK